MTIIGARQIRRLTVSQPSGIIVDMAQRFTQEQVEWEQSTKFDTHRTDMVFELRTVLLADIPGNYGTWKSYHDEEPERMDGMVEDWEDLPPIALDSDLGHLDGAHRIVTARHLGHTYIEAYVAIA